MKALFFFLSLLIGASNSFCSPLISNPISDFENSFEPSGRTLYQWNVDINNDGKIDVLLDVKLTSEEIEGRGKGYDSTYTRWFTAYLASGSQFTKSPFIQSGVGQIGEMVAIKTDECYVGPISEINSYGIVSIEKTSERASSDYVNVARIFSYTVDGSVIKKTKLAEFDPDDSNAIYDKYLSLAKRTTLTIQEVSP